MKFDQAEYLSTPATTENTHLVVQKIRKAATYSVDLLAKRQCQQREARKRHQEVGGEI